MKKVVSVPIPTVDEILQDTSENLEEISANINRITAAMPLVLEESPTNTNLLLLFKRYINDLKNTRLVIPADDLLQIHKLVCVSDNITNATFLRLTDLLRVKWDIIMVNNNHDMVITCDGQHIVDERTHTTAECRLETMLLDLMKYVVREYGDVDMRMGTKYIPNYTVNNIMAAVRNCKKISSYIFERFCKIWNIAYSYTMTSLDDSSVSKTITLDPSGWM